MAFLKKLLSTVLRRRDDVPLVDEATCDMLLSAAGEVGGDLFDLLIPKLQTEEQANSASWESGLFGVATASYFFTIRYAEDIPPLSLATEVASAYRKQILELSVARPDSDSAIRAEQYFETQSQPILKTVQGAIHMYLERPEKMFSELSRNLAQRIRLNSQLHLDLESIDQAMVTMTASFTTLFSTLKAEMEGRATMPLLSEKELFRRAQGCLGELLILEGQSGFKKLVESGYLGFTTHSVFFCAEFDSLGRDTICYVKLSDFPLLKTVRPASDAGPIEFIPEELALSCLEIARAAVKL